MEFDFKAPWRTVPYAPIIVIRILKIALYIYIYIKFILESNDESENIIAEGLLLVPSNTYMNFWFFPVIDEATSFIDKSVEEWWIRWSMFWSHWLQTRSVLNLLFRYRW